MKSVKLNKKELLEIVKKNREAHRGTFLKALEGFRRQALEFFEARIGEIKAGKKVNLYIDLDEPEDQTKDYDRSIKMLEMSVDEIVELSETDFGHLVLDEWNWKQQWSASNSKYLGR